MVSTQDHRDDYPQERVIALSSGRKRCVTVVLCGSCLVMAMETTMLAGVIPTLSKALHGTLSSSLALGTTYLLASAVFQPIITELSHVLGRKTAFLLSLAVYIIGSIVAATSSNMAILLVGRGIQGAGGAGEAVLPSIIMTDIFYLRERSRYMVFLNASVAIGSICGPIVGGALVTISWVSKMSKMSTPSRGNVILTVMIQRWVFWLQTFQGACCVAAIAVGLETPRSGGSTIRDLGRIDWIGILLTLPTSVTCLLPLVLGGSVYAWNDWRTLLCFGLGYGIGLPLLVLHQRFRTLTPMFRAELFCNFTAIAGFTASLLQGLLLWMLLYYGSLFYEVVRGFKPLAVGLMALPATLTMVPTVVIAGWIIRTRGTYGWVNRIGWASTAMGFGLLTLFHRHSSVAHMVIVSLLPGFGLGLSALGSSMTIQRAIHPEHKARATAMCFLVRSTGQCLGVAIGGALFSNSVTSRLEEVQGVGDISVNELYLIVDAWRADDEKVRPVLEAMADSLRCVWIFGCTIAGLMLLLMGPIRYKPLPDIPRNISVQGKGRIRLGSAATLPTEETQVEEVALWNRSVPDNNHDQA
ncbi:major facilitator superfamily domain-containing protein [Xylariales sp. AK1849]|nr:major facilitator superfamily domain-containing protein [Xylariales sp. AK1849]